jgi:hypothetical protein
MKSYIKFQHAHVNQYVTDGEKTDWKIEENKTNELLGILPKKLNEGEVFAILNIIRKAELDAFNTGIDFGKDEVRKYNKLADKKTAEQLQVAREENVRLADALEIATRGQT